MVTGCGSAWLERRLREAEVASSNPATPIHGKMPTLCFQREGIFFVYKDTTLGKKRFREKPIEILYGE
jgi:hypothetical protein